MNLRRVSSLPVLNERAIERAVASFVQDAHTEASGADPRGLYNQTIETLASRLIIAPSESCQVWLADEGGEVMCYVLAHISKDVDNQMCYWITQCWVSPVIRGQRLVKEWFQLLRSEAKRCLCKHIIIPSSRGVEAYCRFLGKGWKPYVTLLKEDI
jgi:hypothetical protein